MNARELGIRELLAEPLVAQALGLAVLLLLAWLAYAVARRGIVAMIRKLAARTRFRWDDQLVQAGVFARLAHLAPALLVWWGAPLVPGLNEVVALLLRRLAISFSILVVVLAFGGLLTAANEIYAANPENRQRPIKGYLQVVKITLAVTAGILILATLLDRSPLIFLSGLGAMAAVLILVFRDTLLSLVASIQLTGYDMVHVGDWIEMPEYGADGDVIDIALHTVKVQNWDKTITTIPTHKLIEGSFRNWRGMSRAGGRRIKRSILLDVNTIRFLDEEEIDRFERFALLRHYIRAKREELRAWNAEPGRDPTIGADIRRLTNVGTLRAYVESYLRHHPRIHQGMTLMVRQLEPTPNGLPLQIYCFTNTTEWGAYEGIQSDILDHVFAIVPEFRLRAFQAPAGRDIARLAPSPAQEP